MSQMWMVRAGQRARYLDDFKEQSVVAIGWTRLELDLSTMASKADLSDALRAVWPEWSPAKVRMAASQVFRFAWKIQVGDQVITYDPQGRVYLLGTVMSDYLNQSGVVATMRSCMAWGPIRPSLCISFTGTALSMSGNPICSRSRSA